MEARLADRHPELQIDVRPALALANRRRLFSALEEAFPVRFVSRGGLPEPDASMSLVFELDDRRGSQPSLHFAHGRRSGAPTDVRLARLNSLAPPLRGAVLTEREGIGKTGLRGEPRMEVLAATAEGPVWISGGHEHWAALAPDELTAGESLRDQLRDGRFAALLPLVHRLRELAPEPWPTPPLRAALVFDDPNLHWPSYGYIRYKELARHACEHGYKATMAMIPRDMWAAHRGATAHFRDTGGPLSLAVHGNDHVKRELTLQLPGEARRALLAQALCRVEAFERRHGVHVARIMVPPHGDTSRETAVEMPRLGFEAMTDSRPIPWLISTPDDEPLAGWVPTDFVDGGLPVIPRYHIARSRDDLPLRAFLGQPLVLYGHHHDVADGLEVLSAAAEDMRALGDVQWLSLGELARTNVSVRQHDSRLEVKLFSSIVDVDIPDGVGELVVHTPALEGSATICVQTTLGGTTSALMDGWTDPLRVAPGTARVSIVRKDALNPHEIQTPRARAWPVIRRIASETRDRGLPALRRSSRTAGPRARVMDGAPT